MNRIEKLVAVLVVVAISCLSSTLSAQSRTVEDGVFTEAQATSGKVVYEARCETCHSMKEYGDLLKSWHGTPLIDFWYNILGNMPVDNPGSLMDTEYTDVIAYILSQNGFPAGELVLDPNNGMDEINIVSP